MAWRETQRQLLPQEHGFCWPSWTVQGKIEAGKCRLRKAPLPSRWLMEELKGPKAAAGLTVQGQALLH